MMDAHLEPNWVVTMVQQEQKLLIITLDEEIDNIQEILKCPDEHSNDPDSLANMYNC